MALFDRLQEASFKGTPFLWSSLTTTGGRKTVTHEFPNQDFRFVEDNGRLDKVFTIPATISEPNYEQKRDALIQAIESAGPGQLVHPTLGSFLVSAKPYTLTESLSELGEAKFQLTFEKVGEIFQPQATQNNQAKISLLSDETNDSLKESFTNNYNIGSSANLEDATVKVDNFVDIFTNTVKNFDLDEAKKADLSQSLEQFETDKNIIIPDGDALSGSILSLIDSFVNSSDNAQTQIDILEGFYNYGDDDTDFTLITQDREERQVNRDLLNGIIQGASLSNAFLSLSQVEFSNEEQLEQQTSAVLDQFQKVINA